MSGRSCSAGRMVFFEAQPLGVNEGPYRPHIRLNAAFSQFQRQLAQGEWPRANASAQPVGVGPRQNRLLVATDLAGRNASSLSPQSLPLRDAGGTDLKPCCNRTNRLAGISTRQGALANIFRIGSCHPCWPPPLPSTQFESEIPPLGNPDSRKKQRALAKAASRAMTTEWDARISPPSSLRTSRGRQGKPRDEAVSRTGSTPTLRPQCGRSLRRSGRRSRGCECWARCGSLRSA